MFLSRSSNGELFPYQSEPLLSAVASRKKITGFTVSSENYPSSANIQINKIKSRHWSLWSSIPDSTVHVLDITDISHRYNFWPINWSYENMINTNCVTSVRAFSECIICLTLICKMLASPGVRVIKVVSSLVSQIIELVEIGISDRP